jgi:hypothetical protein
MSVFMIIEIAIKDNKPYTEYIRRIFNVDI